MPAPVRSGWTSRAWASVRGGALALAQCQADPRRKCHYTPVPDTYREEQQLDDDACVCSSNLCHRMVGLDAFAGTAR